MKSERSTSLNVTSCKGNEIGIIGIFWVVFGLRVKKNPLKKPFVFHLHVHFHATGVNFIFLHEFCSTTYSEVSSLNAH